MYAYTHIFTDKYAVPKQKEAQRDAAALKKHVRKDEVTNQHNLKRTNGTLSSSCVVFINHHQQQHQQQQQQQQQQFYINWNHV